MGIPKETRALQDMEESLEPVKATYGGNLVLNNNNAAKLHALEEGLRISSAQCISKLIVEGDSQVIINLLKRMQYDSPILKISNIWRMESSLDAIQQTIRLISVIIPSRIRHLDKKLADWLENESLKTSEDEWDRPWITLEDDGFSSA
jgi:ribonuclease HI